MRTAHGAPAPTLHRPGGGRVARLAGLASLVDRRRGGQRRSHGVPLLQPHHVTAAARGDHHRHEGVRQGTPARLLRAQPPEEARVHRRVPGRRVGGLLQPGADARVQGHPRGLRRDGRSGGGLRAAHHLHHHPEEAPHASVSEGAERRPPEREREARDGGGLGDHQSLRPRLLSLLPGGNPGNRAPRALPRAGGREQIRFGRHPGHVLLDVLHAVQMHQADLGAGSGELRPSGGAACEADRGRGDGRRDEQHRIGIRAVGRTSFRSFPGQDVLRLMRVRRRHPSIVLLDRTHFPVLLSTFFSRVLGAALVAEIIDDVHLSSGRCAVESL